MTADEALEKLGYKKVVRDSTHAQYRREHYESLDPQPPWEERIVVRPAIKTVEKQYVGEGDMETVLLPFKFDEIPAIAKLLDELEAEA